MLSINYTWPIDKRKKNIVITNARLQQSFYNVILSTSFILITFLKLYNLTIIIFYFIN